jgi:hypothetical protein
MDPGYFPSPKDLEFEAILRNHQGESKTKAALQILNNSKGDLLTNEVRSLNEAKVKHFEFLTNFGETISETPLTHGEILNLREKLEFFVNPRREDIAFEAALESENFNPFQQQQDNSQAPTLLSMRKSYSNSRFKTFNKKFISNDEIIDMNKRKLFNQINK